MTVEKNHVKSEVEVYSEFDFVIWQLNQQPYWNLTLLFHPMNSMPPISYHPVELPYEQPNFSRKTSPMTSQCGSFSSSSSEASLFDLTERFGSPKDTKPKKRRFRKRSADVKDLIHCGMYENSQDPENITLRKYIRIWKNEKDMKFYDCCCGGRRAVQDLHKLKRHVRSIHCHS
jgi:hypothetical protein